MILFCWTIYPIAISFPIVCIIQEWTKFEIFDLVLDMYEKNIFFEKVLTFVSFVYEPLVVTIVCSEAAEDKSFHVGIMVVKNPRSY